MKLTQSGPVRPSATAMWLLVVASGWHMADLLNFVAPNRSATMRRVNSPSAITAAKAKAKPVLDYPPPAASLAWPRYLSWLALTVSTLKGIRRQVLGGAQAVALDPALPSSVRFELIKSRKDLRSRAKSAPKSFAQMLRNAADTLEEVPALLVTVAVLTGDALMKKGEPLTPYRRLGEAEALLFTAGKLHLGMEEKGFMRLLGGDFLFAEGQWILAELGSLPAIKLTSKMIRDVSDGSSKGAAASVELESYSVSALGAEKALHAAFLRTGTYFSAVASGAAWISKADKEVVEALRNYGTNLGCALQLAQFREDAASQDVAMWLARCAERDLRLLPRSSAVRGLRRLAFRVERSCSQTLRQLFKKDSDIQQITGLCFADVEKLQHRLVKLYQEPAADYPTSSDETLKGMGFRRDEVSDQGLEELIAAGLSSHPLPAASEPAPTWPSKEDGGPKAALQASFKCVGRELMEVNAKLDGASLAEPATSDLVREEVLTLFRSGGKRLRPALTLLVARALGADAEAMRDVASLASSVEVLHSASLVHDDILDGADRRRGEPTAHTRLGERSATMVGDFLFATASVLVAELGSLPTVLLISKVVADFGRGELAQSAVRFEAVDYSLEDYLAKSFYKTASLLAAACQSAAVLGKRPPDSKESECSYRFGAYVGLAFQVVDDILDFVATEEELGKPALADLKEGNLGAPVLFAAQDGALSEESRAQLLAAIERRLSEEGDLDLVRRLVAEGKGVEKSKALARRFIDLACLELESFEPGEARSSLRLFAEFVVVRTF